MLPPSPSPCCHLSHFGDGDVPSGAGGAAPGSAGGPIGVGDGVEGSAELRGGDNLENSVPSLPNRCFLPRVLQCDSLFQDLAKLKSRPAHLGVFLRYIFSQADPSPLVRPYRHKIGGGNIHGAARSGSRRALMFCRAPWRGAGSAQSSGSRLLPRPQLCLRRGESPV